MKVFYNIITILFFFLIGIIIGWYYGWLGGQEFYNKWLVLSAYNDGFAQGEQRVINYLLLNKTANYKLGE